MTKTVLIEKIAEKSGFTKKDTEKHLDSFVAAVQEALAEGEEVNVPGLGKFTVKERAGRTGRNPQSGEEIQIPSFRAPAFKAGKQLKEAVK